MSAVWRERLASVAASISGPAPVSLGTITSRPGEPGLPNPVYTEEYDGQARAVLAALLERALRLEPPASIAPDPNTCPNCGQPVDSQRSPYCGTQCREESAFVRQLRGAVEKNGIDAERQASMGQVLWHLLGGGYPGRVALVPDKVRQKLFARNGGKCELCGSPATTIDHIKTACNRPINLRPVCDSCTRAVPYLDPAFLKAKPVQILLDRLAQRVAAHTPVRCCDDPESWDWRAFIAMRAQ